MPRETELGRMWRAYGISAIELSFIFLRCVIFTFLSPDHDCPAASHELPLPFFKHRCTLQSLTSIFQIEQYFLKNQVLFFQLLLVFFFSARHPSKSYLHCLLSLKDFAAHKRHTHSLSPSISTLVYCFSLNWQGAESDISLQGFRSNAPVCVR